MPELPEVEVCRRGLLPELIGRQILGAKARIPKLRCPIPDNLNTLLSGTHILSIRRRGKYLLMDCHADNRPNGSLIIHLGMSGNLRFVSPTQAPEKHDHVDIDLGDMILRYGDPRRFGVILWQEGDALTHPLLASQGVEPLEADFTVDWLIEALSRRSSPIKPVLMDSHLVVGIGNIYASESLFRAGISPLRAANQISDLRIEKLHHAIQETLEAAIAAGGSSIRDYVHSDGGAGCFQVECAVYDRTGQDCIRCGKPIKQIRQTGRSTFYCPNCQR